MIEVDRQIYFSPNFIHTYKITLSSVFNIDLDQCNPKHIYTRFSLTALLLLTVFPDRLPLSDKRPQPLDGIVSLHQFIQISSFNPV